MGNVAPHKVLYALVATILLGVLLNVLLIHYIKNDLRTNEIELAFHFPNGTTVETDLYYSFSDVFKPEDKINGTQGNNNKFKFSFPKTDRVPTNFRLDFGNDRLLTGFTIDSLIISYGKGFTALNQKQVFNHIILNSAAVKLDKNGQQLSFNSVIRPFDPYIVFDPLVKIVADHHPLKWVALLSPFLIFIVLYGKQFFLISKVDIPTVLLIIFIVCIPLKIAWTTFATLLLCAYALFTAVRKKRVDYKNSEALLLLGFFLMFLLLGRPSSLKAIDHQMALLLFSILLMTARLNWERLTGFYVYFILFINAMLVTAGLALLFSFQDIFGLPVSEYFLQIKTYSGNMREWLYYDHAVFLTFFGLVGLLFLKPQYGFNKDKKIMIVGYHILLVGTIILVGARVSILIYLVFLINIILKVGPKMRLWMNTVVFLGITTLLFYNVGSMDQNRLELWSVSWESFKDRPLFGHGLGKSDFVLHQERYMQKANTVIPAILNHSHNQFLTFLLEIGGVGVVLFAFLGFLYIKRKRRYKNMTLVLFIFGLCYVFVTESILQTSKPLYVLCFLFVMITRSREYEIHKELDSQP